MKNSLPHALVFPKTLDLVISHCFVEMAKNCTKIHNKHAERLFCPSNPIGKCGIPIDVAIIDLKVPNHSKTYDYRLNWIPFNPITMTSGIIPQ